MDEARIEAWHIFWKRIGKQPLATIPTMKRWFGIGGLAIPSRHMGDEHYGKARDAFDRAKRNREKAENLKNS